MTVVRLRPTIGHPLILRIAAILSVVIVIFLFGCVGAQAEPLRAELPLPVPPTSSSTTEQDVINDDLKRRVDDLRDVVQFMLAPIGILIGVLTIGGALGVVFSLRDQRRISQFHELAVTSEVSSQRRTEQSYSSFLEESQKTLSIVNETLALAREATDQAAHTMDRKAQISLARIETNARDLLEPVLESAEFESIIEEADVRTRLETIAGELRAIEGYLLLQDIDLQPHSRFVKGMAQYLADDTSEALRTLRGGAQDSSARELQLFAIYWVGYLNDALGEFAKAANVFKSGKENLAEGGLERREFERMADDSAFFAIATTKIDAEPHARFVAVADLLVDLEKNADELHTRDDREARSRTSHELADTRGDLFSWISYRSGQLYEPLLTEKVVLARQFDHELGDRSIAELKDDEEFANTDSDVLRAWALLRAEAIYRFETDSSIYDLMLAFGKSECDFILGERSVVECTEAYRGVEHAAIQQLAGHREHRESVKLASIILACAIRRLHLHRRDRGADVRSEISEVKTAHIRVQDALSGMRDHRLTIYSPLQRRPLARSEYSIEIDSIVRQAVGE